MPNMPQRFYTMVFARDFESLLKYKRERKNKGQMQGYMSKNMVWGETQVALSKCEIRTMLDLIHRAQVLRTGHRFLFDSTMIWLDTLPTIQQQEDKMIVSMRPTEEWAVNPHFSVLWVGLYSG